MLAALRAEVDVSSRSDLRHRLASALEHELDRSRPPSGALVPSARTIASALGVHRNTIHSALELLCERHVLRRDTRGRFVVTSDTGDAGPAPYGRRDVQSHLAQAARLAIAEDMSVDHFEAAAAAAYRATAAAQRSVLFFEPRERLPGIDVQTLSSSLGIPVHEHPRGEPLPRRDCVVVIAMRADVEAARAEIGHDGDVLPLGAAADIDIRLAVANLPNVAHISVLADTAKGADAIARRVHATRADLIVARYTEMPQTLPPETMLVLAPEHLELPGTPATVARYRRGFSELELALVRARINSSERPQASYEGAPAVIFGS